LRKKTLMENSKIEWTDHTFNPWYGCAKVSPGCDQCRGLVKALWPRSMGKQSAPPHIGKLLEIPANGMRRAPAFKRGHGHRPRVFCASLADAFDNQVPLKWRQDLFALIRQCRRLDWLTLTKRPKHFKDATPPPGGRCQVENPESRRHRQR
jgi:protein gp37